MSIFGDPVLTGISKASASGPIASFSDGAKGLPLRSLVANIDPVQDLHGYDNPWPAGARNRIDASAVSSVNRYISKDNGAPTVPSSPSGGEWRYTDYIAVTPGEVLYFGEINSSASLAGSAFYTEDKVYVTGFSATELANASNIRTVPDGASYLRHSFRIDAGYNVTWQTTVYIVKNTDTHKWTPYSNICPITGWSEVNVWVKPTYDPTENPTATIQLGQTTYGATLDVTQGKMVVDRAIVDMGTLTWSRSGTDTAGIYRFSSNIPTVIAESGSAIPRMLCSQYATVSPNKTYLRVNGVSNNLNIAQVMVFDDAYSNGDVAAFKTAMSGVQLVYTLATPITIPLTPTEISTLQGENNVWADSGDVDVEYLKQSLTYIGSYIH